MKKLSFDLLRLAKEGDPEAIDNLIAYLDENVIIPRCTTKYKDEYDHVHSDLDENLRSIGLKLILDVLKTFEFREPPDDFI